MQQRSKITAYALAAAIIGPIILFASCGEESSNNDGAFSPTPPTIGTTPRDPLSPTGTNPGSAPGGSAVGTSAQSLDGSWLFTGFECTAGALTPWAELENQLVSNEGFATPTFQWNSGGSDRGVLRRSHLWTIYGGKAIRESTLAFFSETSPRPSAAAKGLPPPSQTGAGTWKGRVNTQDGDAWTSTKKRYELNRISGGNGRLVLKHGITEGPFIQGIPVDPLLEIINSHIDGKILQGGVSAAILAPIRSIQDHLAKSFDTRFTRSILNFVNEFSSVTETLSYNFNGQTMGFFDASVDAAGLAANPGVRLVDVGACGPNGKAVRRYLRLGDSQPFF